MLDIDPSLQIAVLRTVLATRGIGPALALLNDRTEYRYTGIYRLSDNVMRAEHVFDRAAEHRTWLRAVPLGRSFCQYALLHGEFVIDNASTDSRLAKHPYAGLVESYYGRLLVRDGGTAWGTFIHFDVEPRRIDTREVDFLRHAVPLFAAYLD